MSFTLPMLGQSASLAIVFAAGFVLVNLLHEPTHYLAAKLLGCDAQLTIGSEFGTEFVVPDDKPRWVDRVILLAPTLLGLAVGIAYVALFGWPAATGLTAVGAILWAYYALPSSSDLLGGDRELDMSKPKNSLMAGLLILNAAGALYVASTAGMWADYRPLLLIATQGTGLAGAMLIGLAIIGSEEISPEVTG
jgi:hypothetical protein